MKKLTFTFIIIISLACLLPAPASANTIEPTISIPLPKDYKMGGVVESLAVMSDNVVLATIQASKDGISGDVLLSKSFDNGRTWIEAVPLITHSGNWSPGLSTLLYTKTGKLFLKYTRMVNHPNDNKVWIQSSLDNGKTWSEAKYINTGHNYMCGFSSLELSNGTLLFGISWDEPIPKGHDSRWYGGCGVLISTNGGDNWTIGKEINFLAPTACGTDEPALVELVDHSVYCLMRNQTRQLVYSISSDSGKTWSEPKSSGLISLMRRPRSVVYRLILILFWQAGISVYLKEISWCSHNLQINV